MRVFFEVVKGLWPVFIILTATLIYADGALYDVDMPYKIIEAGNYYGMPLTVSARPQRPLNAFQWTTNTKDLRRHGTMPFCSGRLF